MSSKIVSIIIPIYNAEKSLNRCIKSLVVQGRNNIEIILIDDGSTDQSFSICENWKNSSNNILIYRQENAGVSAARNLGLSKASGQYVLFVDADDELPDNAIDCYMNCDLNRFDLIIGSYREIGRGPNRKIVREKVVFDALSIKLEFDKFDMLLNTPWGKLYRKSIIEQYHLKFDVGRPFSEDHIFNLKYSQYIKECEVIDDIVYNYTLGGVASSLKYYPNMNILNRDLLLEYLFYYCSKEDRYFKKKLKDQFMGSVMHYVCNCEYAEALKKVNQTLDIFSDYLNNQYIDMEHYSEDLRNAIITHDAKQIISIAKRNNWKRIYLKKLKRILIEIEKNFQR